MKIETQALGDGRIQAKVTAGFGALTLIRFGAMQNAHVEVQGSSQQYGANSEIKPPDGATSMTFLLVGNPAAQAGQAPPPTTVPITVFDGCGPSHPWSSFFGGGAQALQSTASIEDAEVREGNAGNTVLTFTIKLSVRSSQPVTVNYATEDGSAKAGADYVAASGTVTFAPGETSKTVTVQVRGNFATEPDKTFTIKLSNPTNASIGRATATARILNDDSGAGASGDSYTATIGQTLNVGAGSGPPPGLLANDQTPSNDAQVTSFGGLSAGGDVTSNTAGSTRDLGNGGSLRVNADGSFSFTPPSNASGSFSFRYRSNSSAGTAEATVTIDVRKMPNAVDDPNYSATGATALNVNAATGVLANDDLGAPPSVVSSFGGGSAGGSVTGTNAGQTKALSNGGSLKVNADGSFSFTAPTGFSGNFTFQYRLTNAAGTDDATVTINVSSGPNAQNDAFAVTIGGPALSGNLTADNGSSADSLGLPAATVTSIGGGDLTGSVTSFSTPASRPLAGGTLTVAADGTIGLTGAATSGTYTFQYRLTNATGTDDATVTIAVQKVPNAVDDSTYSTTPATLLSVNVATGLLANDDRGFPLGNVTKFGGGTLGGTVDTNNAGSTSTAGGHSLKVNADGSFDFTPAVGFTGPFTFEYRLASAAGSDTATVTVNVQGSPDGKDDAFIVTIGGPALAGNLTSNNGSGADNLGAPPGTVTSIGGNDLTGTVTTFPTPASRPLAGGTLTVAADGTIGLAGATTSGTYTFQYRLTNIVGTDDSTVTIEVRLIPDARDDVGFSTSPSTLLTRPAGTLFADNSNGADVLGFPAGAITKFGGGTLGGTVDDNNAGAVSTAGGHSLTVGGDGSFSFTPATGFTGPFTFQYRLANAAGSDTATVTIQVEQAPDAVNDAFTVVIGGPALSGNLVTANNGSGIDVVGVPAATVTSIGGGDLTGTVTTFPTPASRPLAGGTLTVAADGTIGLTGAATAGTYTFQYRLTNTVGTDDATVTITVNRVPDALNDAFSAQIGGPALSGNLVTANNGSGIDDPGAPPATVTSIGGGDLTGTVTTFPTPASQPLAGGTLTVAADGTIGLTGVSTSGTFTFQYRLTNAAGSDDATVTITVNKAPDAVNDAFTVVIGGPALSGNLVTANNGSGIDDVGIPAATVTSIGGGDLTGTVTTFPTPASRPLAGGTLTVAADGTIGLTGAATAGTYTFQYRLTNTAGTDDATVTITVNRIPDALNDAFTVVIGGPALSGNLVTANNGSGIDDPGAPPATVTSIGGGDLTGTVTTFPTPASQPLAGGTLTVAADGTIGLSGAATSGTYTFQYRLTNAAGSDDATVTIVVARPPTAQNDAFTVTVGGAALSGNLVTANNGSGIDDPGAPPGTVTSIGGGDLTGTVTSFPTPASQPLAGGTLTVAADGSIGLTGAATGGTYTFQYRLTNPAGVSDGTVTITVNQAPTANDDAPAATSAPGNALHVAFNAASATLGQNLFNNNPATGTGADVRGFPLATISTFGAISLNGGAPSGSVTTNPAGTPVGLTGGGSLQVNADGTVVFQPPPSFTGLVSFQYRLTNVAGSDDATATIAVGTRPDAVDDFSAGTPLPVTGNVHIDTSRADPTTFSVSTNDLGDGLTLALLGGGTSANGGQVTLNTGTGTLTYNPAAGYTGADSFQYTVTNGFGSNTATVFLGVSNMIWFVDDVVTNGDGRLTSPYNILTPLSGAGGAGDLDESGEVIFLYTGTYTAGLELENTQWFIGQGASLATALSDKGVTLAPYSDALPGTGTAPSINTASGNGLTLADSNTVRGVNFGNSAGNAIGASGKGGTTTVSAVTITATGAGNGVNLTNQSGASSGSVSFNNLDVTTATGTAFSMTGTGTPALNVTNGSTINAASGQGLNLNAVNVGGSGITFDTLTSGGGTNNVSLASVGTGSLVLGAGGNSLTGASGTAFNVSGGSPTVSYNGTITQNNAARVVDIQNTTGGSVTLPATITGGANSTGININAASGNVTFTTVNLGTSGGRIDSDALTISGGGSGTTYGLGTVTIFTTGGAGRGIFLSNVDGTVNTSSGSTVNASGAAAIDVSGPAGLTTLGMSFVRVDASGGTNGIELTNTNGTFTVAGTGGTCSTAVNCTGGAIQNSTSDGVVLNNATNVSLTRMFIGGPDGHGINATDLKGSNTVSTSVITNWDTAGATKNGFSIINNNATLTSLIVTGTSFSGTATSGNGLRMEAQGSSNMTVSVEGSSSFTNIFGDGVNASSISGSTGTINLTVKDSSFTDAAAVGNGGISMNPFGSATFNATIENNTFETIMRPTTNLGAIGMTNGQTATANFTIRGNTINDIIGARGVTLSADGTGLTTLVVDDNDIDRLGSTTKFAIQANMIGAAGVSSPANVKITNNRIGQQAALWTSGNGTAEAIFLLTQNSSTMNSLVSGNIVTANATLEVIRARAISTSTQNVTYQNNTVTDSAGTHVGELAVATGTSPFEGGTICMNATANVLPGGGVGVILVDENTSGTLTVTQASSAALSAANSNATVTIGGSPQFGVAACTTPP